MGTIAKVGNSGPKVRSDCEVTLEIKNSGGIVLDIKSKVEAMFGKEIRKLCTDMLAYFGIEHAKLQMIDSGALAFVQMARIEAAVKKVLKTDKEYLPDILECNTNETAKDMFRFSRLYLPGNAPKMMLNAGIHKPEGIILDLEDAVALDKKDEARYLVRNALRQIDYYGAERMVRINQGERGLKDLDFVVPHHVNLLLIPKCESAEYIKQVDDKIAAIKKDKSFDYNIFYMPIIESAMGVEKAFEIATASPNVAAMAIGLEDYTADIGTLRTNEATESFYARTRLVNACKAAKVQPIDSVFSDVADMEGLKANVQTSKNLGFEGMGCIHPRQIPVIQQGFAPEEKEVVKAKKIVKAFIEAEKQGLAAVSVGTKMIDPPVVKRAERTIKLALNFGLIKENWLEEME